MKRVRYIIINGKRSMKVRRKRGEGGGYLYGAIFAGGHDPFPVRTELDAVDQILVSLVREYAAFPPHIPQLQ
jgi:hypothetical protein